MRAFALALLMLAVAGCATAPPPPPHAVLICRSGTYLPDKGGQLPVIVCRAPDARGYVPEFE